MIPKIYLCIDHRQTLPAAPSGLLAHQIDQLRRLDCECNIEAIRLWADLVAFDWDLLEVDIEKQSKTFTNSRKRDNIQA